jgi:hypothetical protein
LWRLCRRQSHGTNHRRGLSVKQKAADAMLSQRFGAPQIELLGRYEGNATTP